MNSALGGAITEVIETTDAIVATVLNRLTGEDWSSLLFLAETDRPWHELLWWHNKYYRVNGPNDGQMVQVPRKGEPEIPYRRELFYPSPHSRFSLGAEAGAAYFSNDFAVNCCETIEQFSENAELSLEDLLQYEGGNPTPGWYGYPLNFHLSSSAIVMDLTSIHSSFFRFVFGASESDTKKHIWNIIMSRDPDAKRSTQLVALAAARAGFDGIVYTSVRAPIDAVMPDSNLVMLNKGKIESGPPPNNTVERDAHKDGTPPHGERWTASVKEDLQ